MVSHSLSPWVLSTLFPYLHSDSGSLLASQDALKQKQDLLLLCIHLQYHKRNKGNLSSLCRWALPLCLSPLLSTSLLCLKWITPALPKTTPPLVALCSEEYHSSLACLTFSLSPGTIPWHTDKHPSSNSLLFFTWKQNFKVVCFCYLQALFPLSWTSLCEARTWTILTKLLLSRSPETVRCKFNLEFSVLILVVIWWFSSIWYQWSLLNLLNTCLDFLSTFVSPLSQFLFLPFMSLYIKLFQGIIKKIPYSDYRGAN